MARIKTTNWKPGPDAVYALEEHVKNGVATVLPEVVVFEMLDNLIYLGRRPDGTTNLPTRDEKGIYHVTGDLIVASKEIQFNIYKALRPLLMAAGDRPLVLVTAFPRYVSSPCCPDETHCTNFREETFIDSIMCQLAEVRSNFKSFVFGDGIRRANVINPGPLMDDRLAAQHWADPVHPAADAFEELGKLVLESADRLLGKRKLEEDSNLMRANRGGWSGPSNSSREWYGPRSARGPPTQFRGGGANRRGDGNRGPRMRGSGRGYRRDSY